MRVGLLVALIAALPARSKAEDGGGAGDPGGGGGEFEPITARESRHLLVGAGFLGYTKKPKI